MKKLDEKVMELKKAKEKLIADKIEKFMYSIVRDIFFKGYSNHLVIYDEIGLEHELFNYICDCIPNYIRDGGEFLTKTQILPVLKYINKQHGDFFTINYKMYDINGRNGYAFYCSSEVDMYNKPCIIVSKGKSLPQNHNLEQRMDKKHGVAIALEIKAKKLFYKEDDKLVCARKKKHDKKYKYYDIATEELIDIVIDKMNAIINLSNLRAGARIFNEQHRSYPTPFNELPECEVIVKKDMCRFCLYED